MNLDYSCPLLVKCTISDDPKDFTVGEIYECFWIGKTGNAKVIDNQRDENYLLSGEYEIVEDSK